MIGEERIRAHPQASRKLVDLCGHVPLALCVAGARLAARSKWPVSEMVDAMVHERGRLAALRMEDVMAVRSALDISYGALPAGAARMYRLMGLWPGVDFDSGVAAATAVVSRADAKRVLGTLTDANLLDDTAGGRYRFHDLTRLHAHELAHQAESEPTRDEAIRRMLDWCLAATGSASLTVTPYRANGDVILSLRYQPAEPLRFASSSAALDWLDQELPNVLAAARMAVSHRHWSVAWQLADAVWPVFLFRGRQAERLDFDRLGLDAARAGGDQLGEAKMLYRLGTALIKAGEHEQAEARIEEAREAWRRLGRLDRVAGSVRRLGYLALTRGPAGTRRRVVWSGGGRLPGTGRCPAPGGRAQRPGRRVHRDRSPPGGDRGPGRSGQAPRGFPRSTQPGARAHPARPSPRARGEPAGRGRVPGPVAARHARDRLPPGEADALVALGDLAGRAGHTDEARTRYAEAQRVLVSHGSLEEARVRERLAELDRPGQP